MDDAKHIKRMHTIVYGRVQGVGFRFFVQQAAIKLGVAGWVRNQSNGTVVLEVEGPEETLNLFLKLVEKGPNGAKVEQLETEWLSPTQHFDRFTIKRTF